MTTEIRRTTAVMPVVDYEPPPLGAQPCPPPSAVALRRARTEPRRHAVAPAQHDSTQLRAAATFADAVLRRVLEVIDRRRPVAQLRTLLAAGLLDALVSLAGAHGHEGTALLRRVRAQPAGANGDAAEVSATYTRGHRVHAIACRVERVPGPVAGRWLVVALHIG